MLKHSELSYMLSINIRYRFKLGFIPSCHIEIKNKMTDTVGIQVDIRILNPFPTMIAPVASARYPWTNVPMFRMRFSSLGTYIRPAFCYILCLEGTTNLIRLVRCYEWNRCILHAKQGSRHWRDVRKTRPYHIIYLCNPLSNQRCFVPHTIYKIAIKWD